MSGLVDAGEKEEESDGANGDVDDVAGAGCETDLVGEETKFEVVASWYVQQHVFV